MGKISLINYDTIFFRALIALMVVVVVGGGGGIKFALRYVVLPRPYS